MRRTKITMIAAVLASGMLLGGCGDAPYDLTESEENVIVNYSAHVVTKYNTYQKEGLTYVEPESTETVDADETSEPVAEETAETSANPGADTGSTETGIEMPVTATATLADLFGVPGVEFTYVGARVDGSYLAGDYYAMYPDTGKVYVILGIDITNTSETPLDIDILSKIPKFTAIVNGTVKSSAEMTVLNDDFSTFQETMMAGNTRETVLIFQVPDSVTTVDSLQLYVQLDDNIQIIL